MTMEEFEKLRDIVAQSSKIVFFGGAGVSTESGIPDFRSQDGLYAKKYDVPPETILSGDYFRRHTEEFYKFYRDKMLYLSAKPNAAHLKLAEWERAGKLLSVVTQNIDGLHQAAGSKRVWELHGSVHRNFCTACRRNYTAEQILAFGGVPRCTCGGLIKPDVVLYGEQLNDETVVGAVKDIASADLLIVAGTSLTVQPAAGLLYYFRGKNLVLINRDKTSYDSMCNLVLHDSVGEVFARL